MGYLLTTINRIWEASFTAIGSHLTLGLGGILFLGFPASFWCGAYGYAVASGAGYSLAASFGTGIVLALISGIIFAFFYVRMSNDSFAVITLASVLAMDALIRSWDAVTGGVLGIAGVPRPSWADTLLALAVLQTIVVAAAFILEEALIRSPFGRSLRALKENNSALIALGTSAERIGQGVIIAASVLAGVAGMFAAMRVRFLDPSLGGMILLVQALTIAIIANTPKVARLAGMTIAIVLLPELLRFTPLPDAILGYMRDLLYGLVLIILLHYVVSSTTAKRHV